MAKFFDNFEDQGGNFVSGDEKKILMDEGTRFFVTSISGPVTTEFGPRFIVAVEIEGEPRLLGFAQGTVFSRDRMLLAMQEYLEGDDVEFPEVRLTKKGRSQILVDADAAPPEEEE